jgi:thiamine-phosphate pyrophosphorylase
MNKTELLSGIQLYVIADRKMCRGKNLAEIVSQAIQGGAQMIQYRDKESDDSAFLQLALRLREVCKDGDVPFIVNDRVGIAQQINADGVHVGDEDLSVKEAREALGPDKIVGKTARTVQQALIAEREGADYVGLGPVFPTDSKQIDGPIGLDVVRNASQALKIPIFAIGGIKLGNLDQLLEAGGGRIAVISAVVSPDDVKSSARRLRERLRDRNPA